MTKNKLHNVKASGFKTPDDYFNQFEDNLLLELQLKENVSNSGFKAPEGYLNAFKVNVTPIESETKVIPLFNKKTILYVASIAAVFLMLLIIPTSKNNINFASLDSETLENYLLTSDFESVELSHLITNTSTFENSILEETLSDVNLEDYLYNNTELEDLDFDLE
ncbi:hypothetical protein [Hanstruepera flava]|uniref:hypothetical protein n=1 Tax=Hanstruepera flava TaxID=2930218 RepID=UPI002028FDA8|nr:hypothetical protein [Hanstruepera flava]